MRNLINISVALLMILSVLQLANGKDWRKVGEKAIDSLLDSEEINDRQEALMALGAPVWLAQSSSKNEEKPEFTATLYFKYELRKKTSKIQRFVSRWQNVFEEAGMSVKMYPLGDGEVAIVIKGSEELEKAMEFLAMQKEVKEVKKGSSTADEDEKEEADNVDEQSEIIQEEMLDYDSNEIIKDEI